jgi:hypothetical protein
MLTPISFVVFVLIVAASAQTQVEDIFGRSLNQRGITLVDWDGYLANPLIKFYIRPPANAASGVAVLTINGGRLYFDSPGTVSATGPTKTIPTVGAGTSIPVRLSIFPDRDGLDEDYALTIVFTGADHSKATNTVPVHVIDQDLSRSNDFVVTVNFDRDVTGFFTNASFRALVQQAADDWSYFFAGMKLDAVVPGSESTYIWSNNFSGRYSFTNTNHYTGNLLYAYGTTNATHRSGGEGSYSGPVQTSGRLPLTIKRSGGFEAETHGNYNAFGWLLLTNDADWLVTGNLRTETNDFYSIAHHEIGHALIFNPAHPGFRTAKTAGAFTDAAVTNYYAGSVPIDSSDHLRGAVDPASGQGAFGYEYHGEIPRKRWIITKLDLLCSQQTGYALRTSSAFTELTWPKQVLPAATEAIGLAHSFIAIGGIPPYHWEISAGALPPGLTLDSFSGAITGTPSTNGVFNFTIRVRDQDEPSLGITQRFTWKIASAPRVRGALLNQHGEH